jgi:hypothetical protein
MNSNLFNLFKLDSNEEIEDYSKYRFSDKSKLE